MQVFPASPIQYNRGMRQTDNPTLVAIDAALRALPVLPERTADIPKALGRLSILLALMRGQDDLKSARSVSDRQAATELRRVAMALQEFGAAWNDLSATAHAVLTERARHVDGDLVHPVFLLWKRAGHVLDQIEPAATALEQRQLSSRGPKKKREPAEVARFAAKEYERLTGRLPTVVVDPITHQTRGPFIDLVRAIFVAADIDGSAEGFAKTAVRVRRVKEKRDPATAK